MRGQSDIIGVINREDMMANTDYDVNAMTDDEMREYLLNRASDKKAEIFEAYVERVRNQAFKRGVVAGRRGR